MGLYGVRLLGNEVQVEGEQVRGCVGHSGDERTESLRTSAGQLGKLL